MPVGAPVKVWYPPEYSERWEIFLAKLTKHRDLAQFGYKRSSPRQRTQLRQRDPPPPPASSTFSIDESASLNITLDYTSNPLGLAGNCSQLMTRQCNLDICDANIRYACVAWAKLADVQYMGRDEEFYHFWSETGPPKTTQQLSAASEKIELQINESLATMYENAPILLEQSEDDVDLLNISDLAWLYWRLEKYEQSLGLYRRANEKQIHNEDNTIFSRDGPATASLCVGPYRRAELLLMQSALESHRALLTMQALDNDQVDASESDLTALAMQSRLARILLRCGKPVEAKAQAQAALQVYESCHSGIADLYTCMSIFALALRQRGQFVPALHYNEIVYQSRCKLLGPSHIDSLLSCSNTARLLQDLTQYYEALELYKNVLERSTRDLGEQHPMTLHTNNDIAALHRDLGDLEKADVLFTEVLWARSKTLGARHPDTVNTRYDLAQVLCDRLKKSDDGEMCDRARILLTEVVREYERIYGVDSPRLFRAVWALAAVELELDNIMIARDMYGRATAGLWRTLGEDHADYKACKQQWEDLELDATTTRDARAVRLKTPKHPARIVQGLSKSRP